MAARPRKTEWHPTPTRQEWVAVGELTLFAFRPVSKGKVTKIVKEFDPDAIGVIYVSEREDGTKVVLDGAHRSTAVERLWGKTEKVPCLLYEGLTNEQEHHLFVEFNEDRTKPRPIDLFLAKVEYDADAQEIAKIIGDCGYQVAPGQGTGRLQSVQAVEAVFSQASPQALRRTLRILTGAWGTHSSTVNSPMVMAVGVLVARYPKIDDTRLSKTLTLQSASSWTMEARVLKAKISTFSDSRVHTTLAQMIVQTYNKRLQESNRLVWEDRNARSYWDVQK